MSTLSVQPSLGTQWFQAALIENGFEDRLWECYSDRLSALQDTKELLKQLSTKLLEVGEIAFFEVEGK